MDTRALRKGLTVSSFPGQSGAWQGTNARMAKLADAADLKSAGLHRPWGFKSPSGHQQEADKISGWLALSPERKALRDIHSGL
jgi:hypothetical protein